MIMAAVPLHNIYIQTNDAWKSRWKIIFDVNKAEIQNLVKKYLKKFAIGFGVNKSGFELFCQQNL